MNYYKIKKENDVKNIFNDLDINTPMVCRTIPPNGIHCDILYFYIGSLGIFEIIAKTNHTQTCL